MAAKKKSRKKPAAKKRGVKVRTKKSAPKKWAPTPKQQRFIEEYPVDLNASAAAVRAGYSKKTAGQAGHRLLKKVEIQRAIQNRVGKFTARADVTVERILSELSKIGFANLGDYFRITKEGEPFIDLSGITEDQSAALQEIMVEDFKDGRGDDTRDVRRVKIKMLDKSTALDKLGKYLGMFVDRVKIEGGLEITKIQRTIVDPKAGKKRK